MNVKKMPVRTSVFTKYWTLYGGARAILTSGYFYAAVTLTVITFGIWSQAGWWDISVAVLPSMMGFSIAAFALIIAVGNERFLSVLATRPQNWSSSALEGTSAAFFHFLLVQVFALGWAIAAKAVWPLADNLKLLATKAGLSNGTGTTIGHGFQLASGGFGFFLLLYSITCALAASARILSLSLRFGDLLQRERQRELNESRSDEQRPPPPPAIHSQT